MNNNYKDEFKALIQRVKANDVTTPAKTKLNEAASVSLSGDSASDVAELMQIFKNAGLPDAAPVPLAAPTDDKVAFGSVDGPEDDEEGSDEPIGSSPDAKPSMAAMASDMEKDHEPHTDEGIAIPYHGKRSWSEIFKSSTGTVAEFKQIGKGSDFTIWTSYNGSLKRQPHYIVKNDKIIGAGYSMPSALKDAGLKPRDVTTYSRFANGSNLNTMKEIGSQEEYANEPDEEYQDNDYMQHDLAGGINKPKKMFAKAQDGDNAMAVEELSSIKEKLYAALAEKLVGEISNKRLKLYAKAASGSSHEKSASNLASKAGYELGSAHHDDPGSDAGVDDDRKSARRSKYIGKAIDRISKEDEMRTNEISKNRLGDYIDRASSDKSHRAHEIGKINHKASTTGTDADDRDERDYHNNKHGKRSGGIGKAVNKLTGRAKVNATESGKKMFSGYSKGNNKNGHPDKGKLVGESKEVDDILKLNNMLNENKPATKKSSSYAMDLKKLAGI